MLELCPRRHITSVATKNYGRKAGGPAGTVVGAAGGFAAATGGAEIGAALGFVGGPIGVAQGGLAGMLGGLVDKNILDDYSRPSHGLCYL